MREYDGVDKGKLEQLKSALLSYKQGCLDTFNIFKEQHDRTMDFYNKRIEELDRAINK